MSEQDKWNLELVRALEGHQLLAGAAGLIDWGSLRIAHIDTGVTQHPVFSHGSLLLDQGRNFKEPNDPPIDPMNYRGAPGHGTRTCSVLTGDLPGTYIGVARSVPVVPFRVSDWVVLDTLLIEGERHAVAQSLRHAVDVAGCSVASISLGALFSNRALTRAVDHAYEAGIIVVCAGGQFVDEVIYPARLDRTIGVGGITAQRNIWHTYASAEYIDVWAPADDVWRANILTGPGLNETEYSKGDGTSYATPHVAGAAAMWLLQHGTHLQQVYQEGWQIVEAFRFLLHNTSSLIAGETPPNNHAGILDMVALLQAPLPPVTELVKREIEAFDNDFDEDDV